MALLLTASWASGTSYSFEGKWGKLGGLNGEFYRPFDVFVAPNGSVYVADSSNYRIQYFTPTGSYLGKWGTRGEGPGEFMSPVELAVAPGGWVYVADM